MTGAPEGVPPPTGDALAALVARELARRAGAALPTRVAPVDTTLLADGRPTVVDVVAEAGGRLWHLPVGLRRAGDEARFVAGAGDPVLGVVDGPGGLAVAFDALADEETASLLLQAVAGVAPGPGPVWALPDLPAARRVAFGGDAALTVFTDPQAGQGWGVVLQGLVASGFDRMAAPLCFWRRAGHELGVVQQVLTGAPSGTAVALASARVALAAVGGPGPGVSAGGADAAGGVPGAGSFAADARSIGQLAGLLHVAMFRAFGGRPGDPARWSADVAAAVSVGAPALAARPDVRRLLDDLAVLPVPCSAIRTHGDLVLDRIARSPRGWVLDQGGSGGPASREAQAGEDVPSPTGLPGDDPAMADPGPQRWAEGAWPLPYPAGVRRSPVADVADLLWSIGRVAARASSEAAASGAGLAEVRSRAAAWERAARRALVTGYLQVPGVAAMVPADRKALRVLTAAWELGRSVQGAVAGPGSGEAAGGA